MGFKAVQTVWLFWALAQSATAADFIPEGSVYRADAELQSQRDGIVLRGEKGEVEGIRYYIWQDGQAQYARWRIHCSTDSMTDERSCLILKDDIGISVRRHGVSALLIGNQHYPGAPVALRIDSGKPVESMTKGWVGKDASKLVDLASKGTTLRTRYAKWPSKAWVDSETEAAGMAEAVKMAVWMVNQAK